MNGSHGFSSHRFDLISRVRCFEIVTVSAAGIDCNAGTGRVRQESLANAKVSARQQCVYEGS